MSGPSEAGQAIQLEFDWQALFAERARGEVTDALVQIMALANATGIISFSGGYPDPITFPRKELARLLADLLSGEDMTPLQYSPVEGLESTRSYLASRLETLEGSRPHADELMVTSGGIDALELVSKVFLDRHDRVLVEAPTYLGALMAFAGFQAAVEPVPMDACGLDVDAVDRLLAARKAPKLLYTIPDHQNPTGLTLSLERRQALIELARRHGFLIVEDVAYRELGWAEERPPSLWSLGSDVVLQAGTFSKIFFPGVRLGWAVGPADVVSRLTWAKQNSDQGAGALGQRLMEEYGRRGQLDAQIAAAIQLYRERCEATMEALESTMPAGVEWTQPSGGFFTWLTFPGRASATDLAARAIEAGVAFVPGELFFPDGRGYQNARLSYSRVDTKDIGQGIARLARLLGT